ncbi:TPA: Vir protein [Legionella pneumophila]|nr:Vir protein [Legionella pneumophila]
MSSSSGNPEDYDKRMDTLFSRFAAMYGHVWISSYPTADSLKFAKWEWSDALRRFDNQALKQALIHIREHNKFPPTLPEFIACCKDKVARRQLTAVDKKEIQLTCPKIAQEHLKAMLADLTRKS